MEISLKKVVAIAIAGASALAAICAGGSAYALPPDTAHQINLVVAGASAQRNTFQQEFTAICQAGTLDLYRAFPAANQDFRAYSCTLNTTGLPPSIQGRSAKAAARWTPCCSSHCWHCWPWRRGADALSSGDRSANRGPQ